MRTTTISFICIGLLITGHALADDDGEPRLITVTGQAEIRVVPDEVELTLGVETFDPDLAVAKSANDGRVTSILAAADKNGIAKEHIRTEYLSVDPRYTSEYQRREFLHYVVQKTIVITLRDIDRFETLLSACLEAGATHVHGIDFRTTELRKHRDHARDLALDAAREKADAMAARLGKTVGEPHKIQEGNSGWWSWYGSWWGSRGRRGMSQNIIQSAGTAAPTEGPTMPGQIAVTATVNVSFELAD